MNSHVSHNLVSLFSSLQHYINLLLKLLKEKREKKKKKTLFQFSFEVDVMETAVKAYTSV